MRSCLALNSVALITVALWTTSAWCDPDVDEGAHTPRVALLRAIRSLESSFVHGGSGPMIVFEAGWGISASIQPKERGFSPDLPCVRFERLHGGTPVNFDEQSGPPAWVVQFDAARRTLVPHRVSAASETWRASKLVRTYLLAPTAQQGVGVAVDAEGRACGLIPCVVSAGRSYGIYYSQALAQAGRRTPDMTLDSDGEANLNAAVGLCEMTFGRKAVAAPYLLLTFMHLPSRHPWAAESLLEGTILYATTQSPVETEKLLAEAQSKVNQSGMNDLVDGLIQLMKGDREGAHTRLRSAATDERSAWAARVALLRHLKSEPSEGVPEGVLPLPSSKCPPQHLLPIAESLGNFGRHTEVVSLLSTAVEGGLATPRILRAYGRSLAGLGQYKAAEETLMLAMMSPTADSSWHTILGFMYLDMERWRPAVEAFDIAIRGGSQLGKAYLGRAMAKAGLGDLETAKTSALESIQHNPSEARSWVFLGEIAIRLSDRGLFQRALTSLTPLAPTLAEQLRDLAARQQEWRDD